MDFRKKYILLVWVALAVTNPLAQAQTKIERPATVKNTSHLPVTRTQSTVNDKSKAATERPLYKANLDTKALKQPYALKIDPGRLVIRPYSPPAVKPENPSPAAPPNTDILGPNLATPPLPLTTLIPDLAFAPFLDGLHLFRDLYEDANKNSNTFYYLPASYHLRWQKDSEQYSFFIYYLSTVAGERGDVVITAELNPGIDASNISYAEKLLSKKLNKAIKLLPMPLKEAPRVDFGSMLTNFGVKNESISINPPTDFLQPIVMSWKMDRRVDDLLGAMMSQIMLSGNVEFVPYAAEDKKISVPVKFKINDPGTFGRIEFDSLGDLLSGFENKMDFPLTLTRVVVLKDNSSGIFSLKTIRLPENEVQPKARYSFAEKLDSTQISLIGMHTPGKIWVDYAMKECPACKQSVQEKILGGTSSSRVKPITLEVLTPVLFARDSLDGSHLKFRIKSKQGDPNGKSEIVFPFLDLREDNRTLKAAELFVAEGAEIALEYQVFLILNDGTAVEGPWVKGAKEFVTVGTKQVSELFNPL